MVSMLLFFVDVKKSNPPIRNIDIMVLVTAHLYPNCFPMSKLTIIDNSMHTIIKEF